MLAPQVEPVGLVAGVDGCKGGWIVAAAYPDALGEATAAVVKSFEQVFSVFGEPVDIVAVDIPVGLVNEGGRAADRLARKLLGRRASTIFTPPERMLLEFASLNGHLGGSSRAESYEAVNEWSRKFLGHGVQQQAFGIYPKIAEVDRYMQSERDARVHESHPELVFREMNGGGVVGEGKRSEAGRVARESLLRRWLGVEAGEIEVSGDGWAPDDLYDALALVWTAGRIGRGEARRAPEVVDFDASGLDMGIWF